MFKKFSHYSGVHLVCRLSWFADHACKCGGQRSSLGVFPHLSLPYFLRQVLLLNLELSTWHDLMNGEFSEFLSLPLHARISRCVLSNFAFLHMYQWSELSPSHLYIKFLTHWAILSPHFLSVYTYFYPL